MSEDVLARYFEIKDAISLRREELSMLQEELIEIARNLGVPEIDDPASEWNERIRQTLGADAIEINAIWASASSEWACPCCRRTKPACARLGSKAQMLGKLVAHHDHIEEFMDVVLSDLSKDLAIEASSSVDARRFIWRGWELFTRFDRIVICEDCNNAEAKGKKLVGADKFFTFTPREMSSFLRASPNHPHEVDSSAAAAAYSSAKPRYERRVAWLKKLAEYALKGTAWYEPVAFEDRDQHVERIAARALRSFGLDHVGPGTVRYIFFPSHEVDAKHASAWRVKQRPTTPSPSESELEFVIRGNSIFEGLPEGWVCPCCSRSKRDVVRWSQRSKQFRFAVYERNIPDPMAPYGTRKITLCDACHHIFKECHKELRKLLGEQSAPDYPVSFDEIRAIIRLTRHDLHKVNP